MPYICQSSLPICPWMNEVTRKLPGIQPLKEKPCFLIDDVFSLQMQYRDQLLSQKIDKVFFNWFNTQEESQELLDFTLGQLQNNLKYSTDGNIITRPDGVKIDLTKADPIISASRLVQEDILLLKDDGLKHVLKAGVLCFPASWTLAEKKGKSLTEIHRPVPEYDETLAPRMEKMFKNLKPDIPIWRANFLLYDNHELFQPRLENDEKGNSRKKRSKFMRVERQVLLKMQKTQTVVFTIHTFVLPYANLSKRQKQSLRPHIS